MTHILRYTLGTVVVLGVLLMGVWMIGLEDSESSSSRRPWQQFQSPTASIGTEEDPYARRRYDWMRLRDPTTKRIPENIRQKELAFAKQLPSVRRKASTWNRRGPSNIGGRTRALAYDVSDPSGNTILAAGVSGGMWRTTDGGESWTRTFEPGQRPNVTTVVQDTSGGKTDTWYAGTGELIGNTAGDRNAPAYYKGNGIFKSTDGGQTWRQLASTASDPAQFESPFDFIYRVRIDPSNAAQDELYAATYDKIFRSTDGGTSWAAVLEGDVSGQGRSASQTDVAVTSEGVVYATLSSDGEQCGIFRSTDGRSWTEITPSGWPGGQSCRNDYFRTVLDVNPSDESEVWFLSYAPGYGPVGQGVQGAPINHVMWKYDADTGAWTNYSDYLPPRGTFGSFATQRGYDLHVEVHPGNPEILFAGGVNLWRINVAGAPDDRAAWIGGYDPRGGAGLYQPAESDPQHPDQHTIAFHPTDPNVMLTGSDGGVHRTTDNVAEGDGGVTYTSLNNGYFTTQFYHVCMNSDPDDPTVMGGMQDNGTWRTQSADPAEPWTRQQSGDGAECEIVTTDDGQVLRYASAQNGFVNQYPAQRRAYPDGATGRLFVHPFEIDPSDPSVMYYPAGDSLYRNTEMNGRPSSQSFWTALPDIVSDGYAITALKASRRNAPHVLYYGAADADGDATLEPPRLYRLEGARERTEPTEVTGASFPDGAFPSDIAVDPRSSDSVIVAFSNYGVSSLFYSTDGGETWTDVEGNLGTSPDGPSVRSVAILPQPGNDRTIYYVATSVGVYSTTDLTRNTRWKQESPEGIGTVVANDVEVRPSDGQVLVGTHANGVYSSDRPVPLRVENFTTSTEEKRRGVTLTWTMPGAVSPQINVQHRYRGRPFDSEATVENTGARTYRYETDSLPAGPHTFRVRQAEGPDVTRTLKSTQVVIPTDGTYDLTQPAPNPFRRTTSMRLAVREEQPVRAVLYNALGQRVATVLDETLAANSPVDLRVSGERLASGVYFLRVRGKDFEATRQVVLVE
jgi:photosystem II stability/assembly factor-like uncharacterized protein